MWLGDGVVPEDVRAHAVSPEARGDDAGLRHEGDEVVAGAEGHGVPVGEPPLPPVVRDQPGVPARAANRGLVRLYTGTLSSPYCQEHECKENSEDNFDQPREVPLWVFVNIDVFFV